MATEIEINTVINTDRSEQGLSKLRSGLKELISLQGQVGSGTEQFKKLQNAINDTEGKIGDLTDSFQTLKGSGVERLNTSFNLLKEGFTSFDGGKIKTAFQGIGAAMSAIPIFLIIEGLKYLVENFDKLTGSVDDATKKNDELNVSLLKSKNITDDLAASNENRALDVQVLLGKVDKGESELIKNQRKRRDALRDLDLAYNEEYIKIKNGEYDSELDRQNAFVILNTETKKKLKLINETAAIEDKSIRVVNDIEKKKAIKDIEKKEEESFAAKQRRYENEADLFKEVQESKAEDVSFFQTSEELALTNSAQAQNTANEEELYWDKLLQDSLTKQTEYGEKERLEIYKRARDAEKVQDEAKAKATDNFLSAGLALSAAYFNTQLNQAKGNAAAEAKIREKQFKVDKAFAIARAVIDGIRSVQAALILPPPAGYILAAANGVLAAANIAKIASTKFSASGSSSSSASISSDTGGGGVGGAVSSTPTQQIPGAGSNAFNPTGLSNVQADKKKESQRVYVLESDIRNATNRVNVIESRATFG